MRSNHACVLKVPKFKHDTFGKRAFAVCGHLAWNSLPTEIRLCYEIEKFKQALKTKVFTKFVNEPNILVLLLFEIYCEASYNVISTVSGAI